MTEIRDINFITNERDKTVYFLEEFSIFKKESKLKILIIFQLFFICILIVLFYKKEILFIFNKIIYKIFNINIDKEQYEKQKQIIKNINNAMIVCKNEMSFVKYDGKLVPVRDLNGLLIPCFIL